MEITHGLSPKDCPYLKINKLQRMIIYKIDFPSLSHLHLFLSSNPIINKETFYSQKSKEAPSRFAGAPLDVAIDYCIGGYDKDFSLFIKLKKDIDKVNVRHIQTRKSRPSVVGSRPNVPAYVAGVPKSMYRMDRAKEKKFISIYMNLAYTGNTTEEQIRNRGILTLNLIRLLENNDYEIDLRVFESCTVGNEIFAASVGLKKPGELLNVKKCYYPLCAKEFLRRVLSRLKESMPFREKWHMSYGMLLDNERTRTIMGIPDNAIVINAPDEMGIRGIDIYEDADAFWTKLNLSKEIVVPDYVKESKEKEI